MADAGPGPDMTTWPTGRLLSMASRLVEHTWIERLAEAGLTHAGLIALDLLQPGPASQRDLATRARVQEQTMSRTLERLERDGLVSRAQDPADRRRTLVASTPAGTTAWAAARTLETEVFPRSADPDAFRAELLAVIHALSAERWPG
ncbi:MarR family winged helix-turn-helix transcriptional regulator [Frondihabitans australicus]|nr:MarR family transcriptional regulator [Frondihabitans australicus]